MAAELLALAVAWDCMIAINTDAHAPGQLEWQAYGCDKAARHGIAADQVITNLHFLLIILLPGITWIAKRFPTHHMDNAEVFALDKDGVPHQIENLSLPGLLASIALA